MPRAENAAADALVNRRSTARRWRGDEAHDLRSGLALVEHLLRRQLEALEAQGLPAEALADLRAALSEVEELRPPRGAR